MTRKLRDMILRFLLFVFFLPKGSKFEGKKGEQMDKKSCQRPYKGTDNWEANKILRIRYMEKCRGTLSTMKV